MTDAATATYEACVLIVDDEEGVRESLRDLVEMMGCSAIMAASGTEALEMLADRCPCLVVLDLLMPGLTGLETLERMRHQPSLSNVTVVMSTSAPERVPRGIPILAKPIDVEALCGWMRRACRCP